MSGEKNSSWPFRFLVAAAFCMGFSLPLLALDSALPGGMMAEAARLGAGLSLIAGPVLVVLAGLLRR